MCYAACAMLCLTALLCAVLLLLVLCGVVLAYAVWSGAVLCRTLLWWLAVRCFGLHCCVPLRALLLAAPLYAICPSPFFSYFFLFLACFMSRGTVLYLVSGRFAWCCVLLPCGVSVVRCCFGYLWCLLLGVATPVWAPCGALVVVLWWLRVFLVYNVSVLVGCHVVVMWLLSLCVVVCCFLGSLCVVLGSVVAAWSFPGTVLCVGRWCWPVSALLPCCRVLCYAVCFVPCSPPPPSGAFNWGAGEWGPAPL